MTSEIFTTNQSFPNSLLAPYMQIVDLLGMNLHTLHWTEMNCRTHYCYLSNKMPKQKFQQNHHHLMLQQLLTTKIRTILIQLKKPTTIVIISLFTSYDWDDSLNVRFGSCEYRLPECSWFRIITSL